ncbi:MAG: DinB family protein [Candidatus Bathyarchaeota archaeon]|nr:DinB family protein [Candidatus Bathyarchaeota archaeon]
MDVNPATSIGEALLEAFRLIWEMYDDALENIPGEHWRTGEIDYLIPARQVYHAVETADFYSGANPNVFSWGQRFDGGCFDYPPEGLPTREQAREYHDEVRVKVTDWIRGMDAPGISAREKSFPWTGSVVLGRALYLLGHYRQHFGELNAELRRRGLPRIKWTTH